jgi:hypothetical protein
MMYLTLQLKSDATFGAGSGVPGLVDIEIEQDDSGCPFLGGRALKGLLLEEWSNIRYAIGDKASYWNDAATRLYGNIGAMSAGYSNMHVGSATLPPDLLAILHNNVKQKRLSREDVLGSLTDIRRQTSIDTATGIPQHGSLRSMRVLLHDTPLIAFLGFDTSPSADELALLAACVLGVRRAGTGRNRGRGQVTMLLHDQIPTIYTTSDYTKKLFDHFAATIQKQTSGERL